MEELRETQMRKTLKEELILFASVIKWIVLASGAGVIVGLSTTAFLALLSFSTNIADRYAYTFLLLPAAFFLSSVLTKYLAPDAEGHGTEKVIEAIHQRASNIPIAVVPIKLLATVLTLAIGGSAGKEGPCAQIGAGLSSFFAQLFKFDEKDRRKLVICGISAGFATVFGTPIAGAIFGVEVLFVGSLLYDVLLPSFIAGITAYQVASFFKIPYPHIAPVVIPAVNETLLFEVILSAIFFGIVSILLIEGMKAGKTLSNKMKIWAPLKGVAGGSLLVLLAFLFGNQYLGLGLPTIHASLEGQNIPGYTPFLKILFTVITLNCGGSGGLLTPVFFIGATSGSLMGNMLHIDPQIMSAIGFVSLLAGTTNTPIAASIMALEVFGPSIGPYAAVACVVSYLITGHRSIYPSQVMAAAKSSSLNVQAGTELRSVETVYQHRSKTLVGTLTSLFKKMKNKRPRQGQ